MKTRLTFVLAGLAAGCAAATSPPVETTAPMKGAQRGLAFAQQHCAECHGVTANTLSPNPESPPFEDIANRNGLTAETLSQFLIDSHNFPAAMDFTVTGTQASDLAAWMLTMRKPDYQPQR
ncbi:c-type cytochrome [Novosphingobium album (ex Hu et al. 2023)]|uniref:Cytochrome c n=1 Tax=Novosphingobium album (ex Hu et al. 2023) TaxID=2930093 RepID=A0ABT0AW29_9SPHN|nr:cytochrome c [Novosphingobium album (ex Hu et al. 2023)]MCJ2177037.1 cytochrome c [Novosphingobium album (ex Hu et al. 2023)]